MFKVKANETPDKSPKGTLNLGGNGAEDFARIDVPGDGSCLFWSVALAYLIPSQDNEILFKKRYMDLFGKKGNQDSVRKLILSEVFRDDLHKNQSCKGTLTNEMSDLVQKVFRAKVVEYIRSNKREDYIEQITINDLINTKNKSYFTKGGFQEDFIKQFGVSSDTSKLKPSTLSQQEEQELIEEFNKIENSNKVQEFKFNSYLKLMNSPGAWGGHRELEAMAQMLKVRIDISKNGNSLPSCGESFNTKIQLYHVNNGTHYNFGLEKSIISKYESSEEVRSTHQQSSPLKDIGNSPHKQGGTSHSKSPGKENTPPSSSNEKQVSSITDEEGRSSSSRKRKSISSVTSEGIAFLIIIRTSHRKAESTA